MDNFYKLLDVLLYRCRLLTTGLSIFHVMPSPARSFFLLLLLLGLAHGHARGEEGAALLTLVKGSVVRLADGGTTSALEPFVKLRAGDQLRLGKGAAIRVLFFESGRLENWSGEGTVELAPAQGRGDGNLRQDVSTLSRFQVAQIAKTPTADASGRMPPSRTRAIATPEALSRLETEYDRMRVERGINDLNAEIFLLAGLFELRELDRVEVVLSDLESRQKNNAEAKLLIALYRKALSGAKHKR